MEGWHFHFTCIRTYKLYTKPFIRLLRRRKKHTMLDRIQVTFVLAIWSINDASIHCNEEQ